MLIFAMHQKQKNPRKVLIYRDFLCFAILSSGETGIRTPEREAPEPTLSENIIKLQIIDNHILYTMQSKSKSF